MHPIEGSGRMNDCLANVLFAPFNSRFGEIESNGALSQVVCSSVIILYRNPRPHAHDHQKRHEKKRGKQNHSLSVPDEFSPNGHRSQFRRSTLVESVDVIFPPTRGSGFFI